MQSVFNLRLTPRAVPWADRFLAFQAVGSSYLKGVRGSLSPLLLGGGVGGEGAGSLLLPHRADGKAIVAFFFSQEDIFRVDKQVVRAVVPWSCAARTRPVVAAATIISETRVGAEACSRQENGVPIAACTQPAIHTALRCPDYCCVVVKLICLLEVRCLPFLAPVDGCSIVLRQ